ncbi:MAG: hypothetical protein PHV45_06920 [Desulfuromonas thiophila]|nr:hypothetical protein [Desulfuromonas thiophila]
MVKADQVAGGVVRAAASAAVVAAVGGAVLVLRHLAAGGAVNVVAPAVRTPHSNQFGGAVEPAQQYRRQGWLGCCVCVVPIYVGEDSGADGRAGGGARFAVAGRG